MDILLSKNYVFLISQEILTSYPGYSPHYQHHLIIVSTEWLRKLHLERQSGIVNSVLRLQCDGVERIRLEYHSSFFWWEGNNLTVRGYTFIQDCRWPGLVPGTNWFNWLILHSTGILKVSIRTTCVGCCCCILNTSRPFPSTARGPLWWFISAINSCKDN